MRSRAALERTIPLDTSIIVIYNDMPPLRTGLLSFGLVSIPVQLHTATKDQRIAFHLLHDTCGSRVQNRYYCPVCNVTVEREDRVRV